MHFNPLYDLHFTSGLLATDIPSKLPLWLCCTNDS